METLTGRLKGQDGTALIIAVIAMLVLGVIGFSFAILANLETRIGMNQKHEVQALALAEAGIEHGRDVVKGAGSGNFGTWVNNASNGSMLITGQAFNGGTYSVRIDNDCSTNNIVPSVLADPSCGANQDGNEMAALTAWATTSNGLGRARVRVLVTYSNAWKHSCYNGNGQLCIDDQNPACASQSCVSPSDPDNPNGPAKGQLPVPNDMRCGKASLGGSIPDADIPADIVMTGTSPCVIYPYYTWALHTPAPTRTDCMAGNCQTLPPATPAGTLAWNTGNATCTNILTASKCHGMVFFGPALNVANGADISFGTGGGDQAGCMGTQGEDAGRPCYAAGANSSVTVYVMGKVTVKNNVEINGTLVLHGNGVAGSGANKDLGLTGTNRITTNPCTGGSPSPGCGYPLAILAFDPYPPGGPPPNAAADPAPTTAAGQSIFLDISNSTTLIKGIVYTGGTADFNPITVNGSIMGWDVNVNNAATAITYNSTYGNAAPPPGFSTVGGGSFPAVVRQSWIHCRDYSDDSSGPTACSN